MSDEKNYLNLIEDILNTGELRENRTGINTISKFGTHVSFDLKKGFPLLTTKRVFFRGVVEELLFFLSGESDTTILKNKGIKIWEGNTSREFLDKRNLTEFKEGEYGESYGYNWRHFGKEYIPIKHRDEHYLPEGGIDQIKTILQLLKTDKYSRRILFTAWNPSVLDRIPLPPCHIMAQFYVNKNDELNCHVYMRSVDVFLGLPFNIASYSLITHIFAYLSELKVGQIHFSFGDSHIYTNHIEQVKIQLSRDCKELPTIKIKEGIKDIESFTFDSFILQNYISHDTIKADMAI
jgi:thymidylate synthase